MTPAPVTVSWASQTIPLETGVERTAAAAAERGDLPLKLTLKIKPLGLPSISHYCTQILILAAKRENTRK
ncbi:hypothetical protein Mapa_016478 [Marchantia paleacea]|nr:hypothetical protein Mapa_016478 [Marchantia paleacea]